MFYEAFFPNPEQQYPWVRDSASLPYIKTTGDALRSMLETNLPASITAPPGDQQGWLEKRRGDELALERYVRYHIPVT
jgi:membrane protein required for colicin V production